MELVSQTLKGIGWSGVSQFVRLSLRFIISAVLARLLSPRDFGLVGMVAVFSGFISIFRELGLGAAVIQRKDITEEHLSSVFLLNIIAGLFLTLVMIGLAPGIAYFYKEKRLIPITMVLGTRFFISSFAIVQQTLLTKWFEFKKLAIIEISTMALAGGVAIILAFSGAGVWSLVLQSVIFSLLSVIFLWSWSSWRPRLMFYWRRVKELFRFSFNLLGFRFVNYFCRNLDNLLIGKFLGAAALGYYDRAYNLMLLPLDNISSVLSRVMFPAFSAVQDDLGKVREMYLRATRYISVITFPMMLGLFVVAPEFIRVLFGPKWDRSIFLFQVLCLVGMVQSIATTVGWIYLSQGRTDILLRWGIFSTAIIASSFFIGVRWGVEGVAVAYATASFALSYPCFYIPFRLIKLKMRYFLHNFILTGSISFAMAIVVYGCRYYLKYILHSGDIMILLSCVGLGSIIYISLLWTFGRRLFEEIRRLKIRSKLEEGRS